MTDTHTPPLATVPRVRPAVELGVGDTFMPSGTAQWGKDVTAENSFWAPDGATTGYDTWSGEEPSWVDITCHIQDVETYVGRERSIDTWEVGTAAVLADNVDGWADIPPTNPDYPFELTIRPGRPLRVGVYIDDATAPAVLWRGWIDRHEPGFDPEIGETVRFDCIDAKGEAGRAAAALLTTAVGANETATARVNRILDAVGWVQKRSVAATGVQLRSTTLGGRVVDLLNLAADSSGGAVFGDRQGRVVFKGLDWQVRPPGELVDGVIGNVHEEPVPIVLTEGPDGLYDPAGHTFVETPAGSGLYVLAADPADAALFEDPAGTDLYLFAVPVPYPQVCPTGWEIAFDRREIATRVLLSRPSEAPTIANDATGQSLYGLETFERTDLETNLNADLVTLANRHLEVRSRNTMPRIVAVTVDAAADPQAVDLLAVVNPYNASRVSCRHVRADGTAVFVREMIVTGIEYAISPVGGWSARLALDDAGPYTSAGALWETTAHWQQSTWQSN